MSLECSIFATWVLKISRTQIDRFDLEADSTELLSWERRKSKCCPCLLSTGDIDVLIVQYLSANTDLTNGNKVVTYLI